MKINKYQASILVENLRLVQMQRNIPELI